MDRQGLESSLAAFNILDLASLAGVLDAAEEAGTEVITQFSASVVRFYSPSVIVAAAEAERMRRSVRFFVHLDHCRDEELLADSLRAGFEGVMVDGSHLPVEENVAWTRAWATRAHDAGALCEGELGEVRGEEDGIGTEAASDQQANVPDYLAFAEATGVDLLGTDIGTAHGTYERPPTLELGFLADLARHNPEPGFVVHGGSGLATDVLRRLAQLRVRKINFSTDLKLAWWGAVSDSMSAGTGQPSPALVAARHAVRGMALDKIRAVSGSTAP